MNLSILRTTLLFVAFAAVNCIAAQTTTPFATPRFLGGSTVAGDTAYFAGGATSGLMPSSVINLYDRITDTWSTQALSQSRALVGVSATNKHVFFAGGVDPRPTGTSLEIVDIYDRSTNSWSIDTLSDPVVLNMTAANDSLAFFAGGLIAPSGFFAELNGRANVDVYNSNTNTWSTLELSEPRGAGAAVRIGDYFIFAGGLIDEDTPSKRVDIYNAATGEWSIDSLSIARFYFSGVTDGQKAYFAGGLNTEGEHFSVVDVYDPTTREWSTLSLSAARGFVATGFSCGKLIFASGAITNWETRFITEAFTNLDIFDPATQEWTFEELAQQRYGGFPAAFDDQFILASGFSTNGGLVNTSVKYTCSFLTDTREPIVAADKFFTLSPNPVSSNTRLRLNWNDPSELVSEHKPLTYRLINQLGQPVAQGSIVQNELELPVGITPGVHILLVNSSANQLVFSARLIIY